MFCPKCGSILLPKKNTEKKKKKATKDAEAPKRIMACMSCGYSSENVEQNVITERLTPKRDEVVEVISEDQDLSALPLITAECGKCKHQKAYFWTVQTRAGDEPETKFYRCEKCRNTWRDYS